MATQQDAMLIRRLIATGRWLDLDDPAVGERLRPLSDCGHLNGQTPAYWADVLPGLPVPDVVVLAKVLTLAEGPLRWPGGSVSAAIWIMHHLEDRAPAEWEALAPWITAHTTNRYLPFGTTRFRTVEAWRSRFIIMAAQQAAQRAREITDQAAAVARRAARAEAHARHQEQQRERSAARLAHLAPLTSASSAERLVAIAASRLPIDAYPVEWAVLDDSVLGGLPQEVKEKLIVRLAGRRQGPWARVLHRLEATSTGMARSIDYVIGDATAPSAEGPKIITHVCNDVGGWGRGFVVAISRRWPEPERRYRAWHRGDEGQPLALGQVQFVQVAPDTWVANLIGQHGTTAQGGVPLVRYEAVRDGRRRVAPEARRLGASVHMPRIGCGLAGGRWENVEPIIVQELVAKGIPVTVYDLPA